MRPHRIHAACAMLAMALAGCSQTSAPALEPLVGLWTTSAPLYADRSFEVRADGTLVIGVGDGLARPSEIVDVEGGPLDTRRVEYALDYEDAEGELSTLDLVYDALDGVVRLRSRPDVVWTRREVR